ncbi:unnamed protein product [Ceutorhynchus assimilis]|uniref:Uncharacterized protein n=1 Tax=Ceutorhynchus assimilis TaxID=467358 RepID=A0A9N9QFL0_9CUCU|nr:unnamed protein product [Ceutorhynchus assimilis]
MGKGAGVNFNLDFILRIIELVILILALVFFFLRGYIVDALVAEHKFSLSEGLDALSISSSAFIFILAVALGMQIFKSNELDKEFEAWLFTVGATLLIACGIVVCIYSDRFYNATRLLIGGLIGIVGGCALLVNALKDFNVF